MTTALSQKEFGQFLRRIREERMGLTRSQVAKDLGVHQSYIAHLENGTKVAQPAILLRLARVLRIEPVLLLARAGHWEMPGLRMGDFALDPKQQLDQLWDYLGEPEREELLRIARYLALRQRLETDWSASQVL